MKVESAYLIFKSDFKKRNWIDWIKSHIMLAPPPFRFNGALTFDYNGMTFTGYDDYLKEELTFTIKKDAMEQLFYGYDDTFHIGQTRGAGIA